MNFSKYQKLTFTEIDLFFFLNQSIFNWGKNEKTKRLETGDKGMIWTNIKKLDKHMHNCIWWTPY